MREICKVIDIHQMLIKMKIALNKIVFFLFVDCKILISIVKVLVML